MSSLFKSTTKEVPQLSLVFDEGGGGRLLLEASFKFDAELDPLHNLVELPPQGKTFRALCILLLLAKYRGENPPEKNGKPQKRSLVFRVNTRKTTWIQTIADYFSKKPKQDLIGTYFRSHQFFSGSRGTPQLAPSARYEPATLELYNLKLSKSASLEVEPIPLVGEELVRHAIKIEKFECEREGSKKWTPIVDTWVRQFKNRQVADSDEEGVNLLRDVEPQSYILSPCWEELFDRVRHQLRRKIPGGNWYIVCDSPLIFSMEWVEILREAVNSKGATIHFAYQSPHAAKKCPSVRAQLRMNKPQFKGKDAIKFVEMHFGGLKKEMATWKNREIRTDGTFKFYESKITHPFIAVMYVPAPKKNAAATNPGTPNGTWCLLVLLPLYSASEDEHCGLCLRGPSPMLDIYYNSIVKFFEQGPKDGYLEEVNLFECIEAEYFWQKEMEMMKQTRELPGEY